MSRLTLRRPSPAMAVAFVALLAALSGTAVALPGKNGVKKDDIAKGAVNSSDVKNNAVTSTDIRNSTIRGRDVRSNTLTGSDVNESTFGKVPSASVADGATAANSANVANSVNTVRTIGVATVAESGTQVTLATYGPFTLTGTCLPSAANTVANLNIATTEDNSIANGLGTEINDLDVADGASNIDTESDAAGGDPNGGSYDATLNALAPSGRAFTGHIALLSDASAGTSGACRFHGNIVISG